MTFDLGAMLTGVFAGVASALTSHAVVLWRVRNLEKRMKAVDEPPNGALFRLERLEARRAR